MQEASSLYNPFPLNTGDVEELALMPLLIPPDEAEYGGRPHSKSSETTPPKATPSNLDVVDALLSPVNEEQYSVGNKSSLQGPVLDYTREPSVETQRRSTSKYVWACGKVEMV